MMYRYSEDSSRKVLESLLRDLSIESFSRHLEGIPVEDAVNMARHIFGSSSREVEYIAGTYNVRLSDVPTEIDLDGDKHWKNDNGKFHREDGPAIKYANGTKEWYLNGKLHRIDGPAIEHADGYKIWSINGMKYSEEEFNKKIKELNNGGEL